MISYNLFSNKGNRPINEDAVVMGEKNGVYCFLAADGLGGHGDGDVASALVAEVVMKLFEEEGSMTDAFLRKAFQEAQNELLKKQEELNKQTAMKTTCSILLTDGYRARWGHIGDTRIYRLWRNGRYECTKDHSVPQMLVMMGELKESQIRGHIDRNRLLRVMGVTWDTPQYTITGEVKLDMENEFLMCTDGFWELIEEEKMIELLRKSRDVKEWMDLMTEEVKKNGAGKNMDNFSAIGVRIFQTEQMFFEEEDEDEKTMTVFKENTNYSNKEEFFVNAEFFSVREKKMESLEASEIKPICPKTGKSQIPFPEMQEGQILSFKKITKVSPLIVQQAEEIKQLTDLVRNSKRIDTDNKKEGEE